MKPISMFYGCCRRSKVTILAVFLGLTVFVFAQGPKPNDRAASASASAATPVPVLVELFTSEGCSSCPPADIILKRLDDFQPISGAQLIVLSEHVTYWDQLGWKDPNSSPKFTDRQSSYERRLAIPEPYTPQFVIDGSQSVSLENLHALEDALNKAKENAKLPIAIRDVSLDPSNPTVVRAHIAVAANVEKHSADVYVALALNHVESKVLRGENGGKQLVHVAVVQQLTKIGKLSNGKAFEEDIQLKVERPEGLENVRIVALAQDPGPGKLLGAAMWKSAD